MVLALRAGGGLALDLAHCNCSTSVLSRCIAVPANLVVAPLLTPSRSGRWRGPCCAVTLPALLAPLAFWPLGALCACCCC